MYMHEHVEKVSRHSDLVGPLICMDPAGDMQANYSLADWQASWKELSFANLVV